MPTTGVGSTTGLHTTLARVLASEITLAGTRLTEALLVTAILAPHAGVAQTVEGTLLDARSGRAIARADVLLMDAESCVVATSASDQTGHFVLRAPAAGAYAVAAQKSGYASTLSETIELAVGQTLELRLSVSAVALSDFGTFSDATLSSLVGRSVAATCGSAHDPERHGILVGMVSDSATGVGLPGAAVVMEWRAARESADTLSSARVEADDAGAYVICDAPAGEAVVLTVRALEDRVASATVGVEAGVLSRRDLKLVLTAASSGASVVGRIVDTESGTGLAYADVSLEGSGFSAVTNRQGYFRFKGVPGGVYLLRVAHIGYGSQSRPVSLVGRPQEMTISMAPDALEIEGLTVAVRSRRWFGDRDMLQHRMDLGFGKFVTEDELKMRGVSSINHALRGMSRVRFARARAGRQRPILGLGCTPPVWLDGIPYRVDPVMGFDDPIMFDVEVMEVYRSAAELPGEFNNGFNRCAIVLWTKRGR